MDLGEDRLRATEREHAALLGRGDATVDREVTEQDRAAEHDQGWIAVVARSVKSVGAAVVDRRERNDRR